MSTKRITVDVTAEDIEHGDRVDCRFCPVSIAMERATGMECAVSQAGWSFLDDESTSFDVESDVQKFPKGVSIFITDFDQGRKVEPFSFEIEVPT